MTINIKGRRDLLNNSLDPVTFMNTGFVSVLMMLAITAVSAAV